MFKITNSTFFLLMFLVALLFNASASASAFEEVIQECESCHGKDGNSKRSHIPTIAGVSEYYFLDTMSSFRKEERPASLIKRNNLPDTDMHDCAQSISEEMTKKLASYYSNKTFIRHAQEFDAVKAKAGRKHFRKYCEKCHEDGGRSSDDDAGILAGQQTQYLEETFAQIISGKRKVGKKMKKKLERLLNKSGSNSIDELIHFFAQESK